MKREIRAYQETYLNRAQAVLGDAFHYAVNVCGISGSDFVKLFVGSSISSRFENGEPEYLTGKSGIEIAVEIIEETTDKQIHVEQQNTMERSEEYWIGWAVAYYPFGCIYVNIDKEGNSPIANWVRSLESGLDAYVYHCILTDSILSMLFVTEREHGELFSPRCSAEYIGVAVVDMDSLDTGFAEIQLGKCGDVLVRIA